MNLREQISTLVLRELKNHLEEGKVIAQDLGEDGRPPLTRAQRWRFTAQSLLRATLIEGHPLLQRFDRHCYYGLLDKKRFLKAIDLFEAAATAVSDHGLAFRFGMIRALLEPVAVASENVPQCVHDAGLWHALATLATLVGVRGPNEHPSQSVLYDRLLQRGFLDVDIAQSLKLGEPSQVRVAAATLLRMLEKCEHDAE